MSLKIVAVSESEVAISFPVVDRTSKTPNFSVVFRDYSRQPA